MTKTDLHHLVDELPDDAVDGASVLIKGMLEGEIDPSQAWAWTPEWRQQLRSSLEDLAQGKTERHADADSFLDTLK